MSPAKDWNEALPIGNGRIAGMVFGGIGREQIQVNEESVWYGGPMDRNNPSAKEKLPVIQKLIKDGQIHKAERLCKQAIGGTPQGMRIYQTLGDIAIDFDFGKDIDINDISNYERGLDVQRALSYTSFEYDKTLYTREIFMSAPDDVCVMHFVAEGKNKLNLDVLQTRHHIYEYSRKSKNDSIILGGNLGRDGLDYAMMCKAKVVDGEVEIIGESIDIKDASEVFLYWSACTTYRIENKTENVERMLENKLNDLLNKAAVIEYNEIKDKHIKDYLGYFDRISLQLGDDDQINTTYSIPTDKILQEISVGKTDLSLEQLYFNFGRYLLISCSRPGTLPATL